MSSALWERFQSISLIVICEYRTHTIVTMQEVQQLLGGLLISFIILRTLGARVAPIQTQVNLFRLENSANTLRTAMHLDG